MATWYLAAFTPTLVKREKDICTPPLPPPRKHDLLLLHRTLTTMETTSYIRFESMDGACEVHDAGKKGSLVDAPAPDPNTPPYDSFDAVGVAEKAKLLQTDAPEGSFVVHDAPFFQQPHIQNRRIQDVSRPIAAPAGKTGPS